MKYSLIRESKVVVEYQGRAFQFDALANLNADTSFEEYNTLRKTLHMHTNYADSKIVAKNVSNLSLTVNLTTNFLEGMFFEWLGMNRVNQTSRFLFPTVPNAVEPVFVTLYIINPNNRCTMYTHCLITSIDFNFNREVMVFQIGLEAGNFTPVTSFPDGFSLSQGAVMPYSPVRVSSNSQEIPGLIDASISVQQQCTWRYERSIHDVNSIYNNTRAYVNEMNMSANLNFYLVHRNATDATLGLDPVMAMPLTIATRYFTVDFPSTRVTKRLNHSDVYTISWDVIPQMARDNPTITFNGESK